jgi:DNA polymerase
MIVYQYVGLDFETYSGASLPDVGLFNYVNDPDFRPLIASLRRRYDAPLRFDFIADPDAVEKLRKELAGRHVAAHNAIFEKAVLDAIGIHIESDRFIDTAMLARAAGAAGKLEAAAPQLLGIDKMESGMRLIKLFCIPGKLQEANGSNAFDPAIIDQFPDDWKEFGEYCDLDALLGLELAELLLPDFPEKEHLNAAVTMDMNTTGWCVDLTAVNWMQDLYEANLVELVRSFRQDVASPDLNFNSTPQLRKWCAVRGINAKSFDEAAVKKLIAAIERRLQSPLTKPGQVDDFREVLRMLQTKQALGGSSLKKLKVILDTTAKDGRLRDQYMHIGAGATFRTTGRGAQMQNLPRLKDGGFAGGASGLMPYYTQWSNSELSENIRLLFTASHPNGQLVVGDFGSIESRGLAWQSGEEWKLEAYRNNQDVYKVLASRIFNTPVEDVTKPQRQTGKQGELSCGYQAAGEAVHSFVAKMGDVMTMEEATSLVSDWRKQNPKTVEYWWDLDTALRKVVAGAPRAIVLLPHGEVVIERVRAPGSLSKQHPGVSSLQVEMYTYANSTWDPQRQRYANLVFTRVIHGVHEAGRNLRYYKPSQRKTGELWTNKFTDPKTKMTKYYSIYGGKLAGILTQSLCRELFFDSLRHIHSWVEKQPNVRLVGQFHDEIILDWTPGWTSLHATQEALTLAMTVCALDDFPLAVDVKHAYRYTK